jgi:5,10-methylene-tetrahydrofolate dehydrogenase/Methenyl tetrahydrofolate cyclohydrolase
MKKIASFITPVPGGVDPVAIAMTTKNIVMLSKRMVEYDVFEPGSALYQALGHIKP